MESAMLLDEQRKSFNIRLRWKVANKELTVIKGYSYSFFKFQFLLLEQGVISDFTELVTDDKVPHPIDICNFFLDRKIYFKLKFRYIKGMSEKLNEEMYLLVQELNKQYKQILKSIKHWRFKKEIEKKIINGKLGTSFLFELHDCWKHKVLVLQADSNIWWKPKKRTFDTEIMKGTSVGWLFAQIVVCQYKQGVKPRASEEGGSI